MKPTLLLLVAAVLVIGVACGIFVLSAPPGDDSGRPLSGAIAVPGPTSEKPTPTRTPTPPWPTTLTLATASGKEPCGGSCY